MATIRPLYGHYTATIRPLYGHYTATIQPLYGHFMTLCWNQSVQSEYSLMRRNTNWTLWILQEESLLVMQAHYTLQPSATDRLRVKIWHSISSSTNLLGQYCRSNVAVPLRYHTRRIWSALTPQRHQQKISVTTFDREKSIIVITRYLPMFTQIYTRLILLLAYYFISRGLVTWVGV